MNIYVTGAVLAGNAISINRYQAIKNLFSNFCDSIYTPIETMKFSGSNAERFLIAQNSINESDVIIADVSLPSTGQGMELMLAKLTGKTVICIAEDNSKVSGLVLGAFKDIFYYNSTEQIIQFLTENVINKFNTDK